MKNITVCIFIKNREPGLLSIADGRVKSLVPVFGGTRIIDYYTAPFASFKDAKVFVFAERDAAALKDHLVYTYNTGRIKIIDDADTFSAFLKVVYGKKRGGLLFMRADGALVAGWITLIRQMEELTEGTYAIMARDGHTFGIYISEGMLRQELADLGDISDRQGSVDRIWDAIMGYFTADAKAINCNARYLPFTTVVEYYKTHITLLDRLKDNIQLFSSPLRSMNDESSSRIGNGGFVRNSHISSSCLVEGMVDRSILFPGVRVGNNARVVNSIVMENNYIGEGAVVRNSIICGNSELFSKVSPNIGDKAVVGEEEMSGANSEYPEFLRDGITLVGRNVEIPRKFRISGNCYIASDVDRSVLRGKERVAAGDCVRA